MKELHAGHYAFSGRLHAHELQRSDATGDARLDADELRAACEGSAPGQEPIAILRAQRGFSPSIAAFLSGKE